VSDEPRHDSPATPAAWARAAGLRWLLLAALAAIALLAVAGVSAATVALALALVAGASLASVAGAATPAPQSLAGEAGSAGQALPSVDELAAAVVDPLIIFDRAGTVVHLNAAAGRAFPGLPAGASLALRFRAPEIQRLIDSVISTGQAGVADYLERLPVERWFRVNAAPAGERGSLFVIIFRDQSEVRRIDRMRADFIANASHELRTPLASVAGFIETLRGPARNDAAARDQFLQIMQAQTGRMARLIDDLLSLSRLEMKPFFDASERVDLVPLLGGVVDALSPLAAETGVTLERQFGDGPAIVAGTRDELIQVFENLIENACKYGRSGGRVEIAIDRAGADSGVDVSVRDFGDGIPEEHIPRLTERFYRVDADSSRGQKGTGLGLAIVKHILTRHRARLSIRSRMGEGSTFTVHFPPL